jgi:hypothetical protein
MGFPRDLIFVILTDRKIIGQRIIWRTHTYDSHFYETSHPHDPLPEPPHHHAFPILHFTNRNAFLKCLKFKMRRFA